MTVEELQKLWKKWLIDIDSTETSVAKEIGKCQQNLNRSINRGSIKFLDLVNIFEKYGYVFSITPKKEETLSFR